MKIKVCGMKYDKNVKMVADLRPDYMGFIFYKGSKRFFDGEIPDLSADIRKIGVFVNENIQVIIDLVKKHGLNGVQLHGDESALFCMELKQLMGPDSEVIKAFALSEGFDFKSLESYLESCDYFLFDTKGQERGGNGMLFDWELLKKYRLGKPFFLSGGIGLEEVDSVNKFLNSELSTSCYGIDVNSKFESKPGLKKIDELNSFIQLTQKEN